MVSNTQVFEAMTELTKHWQLIEENFGPMIFKVQGCPLSIDRFQEDGKIHLMYDGRPVLACKVVEKIEAAKYLAAFYTLFKKHKEGMLDLAANALVETTKMIHELGVSNDSSV